MIEYSVRFLRFSQTFLPTNNANFGVRGRVRAFQSGDMSPRSKTRFARFAGLQRQFRGKNRFALFGAKCLKFGANFFVR